MLEIYTKADWMPVNNIQNYYTVYEYDGTQTLCFDISPDDEMYQYIANETPVKNEENRYLIKDINKRKTACTITCSLDMDDWHQNEPYLSTKDIAKFQTKSLSAILESIKPSGWTIINAGIRSIQRTVEIDDASDYDVLLKCQEIFSVTFGINNLDKKIIVIDPDQSVDKGIYITPQLNLESMTMKGVSKDFATRITAYGKQNEDGTYVNFASINGGKTYVEDNSYAKKEHPIWIIWKDERYTVPESLLADAKKKLKNQAYPMLSFEVSVNDLASTNEQYSFLKMSLYDIVHVIVDEHTEIMEKVIKMQKYHDTPEKNKITLSSKPQTITGKVNDAISILGEDGEKMKGSILQQAQQAATKLINSWAEKGHVYMTENEIYVLDALPKETAKYCIRINLGGIGFSQNGWQGPYLSAWTIDGKFNADFIAGLKLVGNEIEGGSININDMFKVDSDGNVTMKQGSININDMFKVDSNGNVTMKKGSINIADLFIVDSNGDVVINKGTFKDSIDTKKSVKIGSDLYMIPEESDRMKNIFFGNSRISYSRNESSGYYSLEMLTGKVEERLYSSIETSYDKEHPNISGVYLSATNGVDVNSLYVWPNGSSFGGDLMVIGNLSSTGSKSRVVETENHGLRRMNAVESADCLFTDCGSAKTNEKGICKIQFDEMWMETVSTDRTYFVFLTPCGDGNIYCAEKYSDYFIVKGTPELSFDWMVQAKQKGYEEVRMEEYKEGDSGWIR